MSVYAALDGEVGDQLGTTSGWGAFRDWALALDDAPDLAHLVEHGWDEDLAAVETQLAAGLKASAPEADTRDIAEGLGRILADRGSAAVLTITDGMAPAADDA